MTHPAQAQKTYSGNGDGGRITPMRKGERRGGRQRGTPNKMNTVLKDAILLAAEAAGNEKNNDGLVGYFKWIGVKHPRTFCSLLGRLMVAQERKIKLVEFNPSELKDLLLRRGMLREIVYEGRSRYLFVDAAPN